MSYPILETERLILKPTHPEDASFLLALLNSPKWLEHIGNRNVNTVAEAEQYIQIRMLPQLERLGYSNNTVTLKETEEKIGVCGIYDREGVEGVDIGFAFLPDFEKKGYAYESATALIDTAFTHYGITQLNAMTTHTNIDSQKLLEKLGFQYAENIFIPNDEEELRRYELKKEIQ
jgi:[ribosomal protein S5]-alanine N-acetyltransferase